MIVDSQFVPATGLTSAHLQTIMPNFFKGEPITDLTREELVLDNGYPLQLDWINRQSNGPIVILLHGLAASTNSYYMRAIAAAVKLIGWRAVVMHYPGLDGDTKQGSRLYHMGDTLALRSLANDLNTSYPNERLFAVGYSMGGNLLLKYLGESSHHTPINAAIAISTPFDLRRVANHLRHGTAKLYQRFLMSDLLSVIKERHREAPLPFDLHEAVNLNSFWQLDEITAPLHGFADAAEYYHFSSSRQHLKHIQIPTLCINSLDDPIMPTMVLPTNDELSQQVTLELSQQGGHVGFLQGTWWQPTSWLQERIMGYFRML